MNRYVRGVLIVLQLLLAFFGISWAFYLIRLESDLAVLAALALFIGGIFMVLKSMINTAKLFVTVVCLAVLGTGCAERIDPGYAGIVVNYYGGDKGVDDFPVVTGMNWYNPMTTSILEYPTFVQTVQWTKDSGDDGLSEEVVFNDKDGLSIGVDISLSYQISPDKVPAFYVKFRTEDLDKFTHGFMRNIARDSFNELGVNYSAEQVYGGQKEPFLNAVRDRVNKEVAAFGIVIQQFGVVGAMRLPPNVVEALNSKIKATQDAQRIENELRSATAEAQKLVAEAEGYSRVQKLRGEADANYNRLLAESLTPLLVQNRTISQWDGKLPTTAVGSNTPVIFGGVK